MNKIAQAIFDECLTDNVSPAQFLLNLREALTAHITRRRGRAPEEVALLNDQKLIAEISKSYHTQFNK